MPSLLTTTAGIMIGLSIAWLARNIVSTLASLDNNPGVSFIDLFFTTTNERGVNDGRLFLITWGPMVLLPLGLALAAAGGVVSRARARGLFADYQTRGWIAQQFPVAISSALVPNRAARRDIAIVAGPNVESDEMWAALKRWDERRNAMTGRDRRREERLITTGLRNPFTHRARFVGTLVPELPPHTLIAVRKGKGSHVAVVAGKRERPWVVALRD